MTSTEWNVSWHLVIALLAPLFYLLPPNLYFFDIEPFNVICIADLLWKFSHITGACVEVHYKLWYTPLAKAVVEDRFLPSHIYKTALPIEI